MFLSKNFAVRLVYNLPPLTTLCSYRIFLSLYFNNFTMMYFSVGQFCSCPEWVSEVTQSCLTLCNPMDCSLPGSPLHGILQARVLEWVAISFSRGSSRPTDRTQISHIAGRCFNLWATRDLVLIMPLTKPLNQLVF